MRAFDRVVETSSATPSTSSWGVTTVSLSGTSPSVQFIGGGSTACKKFVDKHASGDRVLVHIFQTSDPSLWVVASCKFTDATPDTLVFGVQDIYDGSSGFGVLPTFTGAVTCEEGATANLPASPAQHLTVSFRAHQANRVWQGACYWNGHVITTTDRDETFTATNTGAATFENRITVYDLAGKKVSELLDAYTGTDPGGKFMSFGGPSVIDGYLYITCYNLNSGGSPLLSKVARYTIDPLTFAIALDAGFGTSGVVTLNGVGTAEHVTKKGGDFFVCYHDLTNIERYNSSWTYQTNYTLTQAYPADGGPQAMIWEGDTVYLNMHGPNFPGGTQSRQIHEYTWSGTAFTYVQTLTGPSYGATQCAGKTPWGYVWGDRAANRVLFTPDLIESQLRAHSARSNQVDLYKPTMSNGWVDFDATFDRTAKVYMDHGSGRVWLEGIIKSGTTTNGTKIFNVPAYMRPKFSKNFATVSNDAFGAVGVVGNNAGSGTTGDVIVRVASATWLSLDGVSWLADD